MSRWQICTASSSTLRWGAMMLLVSSSSTKDSRKRSTENLPVYKTSIRGWGTLKTCMKGFWRLAIGYRNKRLRLRWNMLCWNRNMQLKNTKNILGSIVTAAQNYAEVPPTVKIRAHSTATMSASVTLMKTQCFQLVNLQAWRDISSKS